MPLTPRKVALSARAGLALCAAGMLSAEAIEPTAMPLVLAGGGWCASLLALLAFPRVRKNDLLLAIGASHSVAGLLVAVPNLEAGLLNAAAGAFGPGFIALTLSVMYVRGLANANWHMPFVEWRQLDRRRRPSDRPAEARQIRTVQIDA